MPCWRWCILLFVLLQTAKSTKAFSLRSLPWDLIWRELLISKPDRNVEVQNTVIVHSLASTLYKALLEVFTPSWSRKKFIASCATIEELAPIINPEGKIEKFWLIRLDLKRRLVWTWVHWWRQNIRGSKMMRCFGGKRETRFEYKVEKCIMDSEKRVCWRSKDRGPENTGWQFLGNWRPCTFS